MVGDERAVSPISRSQISITGGLLASVQKRARTRTISHVLERLEADGRIKNFENAAAGDPELDREGRPSCDADLYKWLEGACYVLERTQDPDLANTIEDIVDTIAEAQRDDGYLNTYFDLEAPGERWTNLGMMHELYAAGHLFEAAVAHHEVTGSGTLLDVAIRYADHIDETFGDDEAQLRGYPGHQEIELALVRLAEARDESRYLDLAEYFIDERGREDSRFRWEFEHLDQIVGERHDVYRRLYGGENGEYDGKYAQDHAPVREQAAVVGHAVKGMYLYCGMTDVAMRSGDESLVRALNRLWENMVEKRMYITGGLGSTSQNEGFTSDYDLPTHDSYAETCAAIGNVMWSHRMFQLTGDGEYLDVLERALFNGVLAGISLDGTEFFYRNPLADDGEHERTEWFERCPCCPTNLVRFLPVLERYCFASTEDTIYVTLYTENTLSTELSGGDVRLEQTTDYPWSGEVQFTLASAEPSRFCLALRIPDWCREWTIEVNDEPIEQSPDGSFLMIDRHWVEGDKVRLYLEMTPRLVVANPRVQSVVGLAAVERGPLVYCFEEYDNEPVLDRYAISQEISTESANEFVDVDALQVQSTVDDPGAWADSLYLSLSEPNRSESVATAIPYFAWNNRGPNEMRVWMRPAKETGRVQ